MDVFVICKFNAKEKMGIYHGLGMLNFPAFVLISRQYTWESSRSKRDELSLKGDMLYFL